MSDMLKDIIDEWDLNINFNAILNRYIVALERDNAFQSNHRAKGNYKSRLKKLHKEGKTDGREYTKFTQWIDRMASREQKEAERRAIKINEQWKEKYEKLLEEYNKLKESMN